MAIALSQHPRVDWVEEEGRLLPTAVQFNPPWGLDRIDQVSLPLNAQYVFNATGSGVRAYIIDTGIRTTHVESKDVRPSELISYRAYFLTIAQRLRPTMTAAGMELTSPAPSAAPLLV